MLRFTLLIVILSLSYSYLFNGASFGTRIHSIRGMKFKSSILDPISTENSLSNNKNVNMIRRDTDYPSDFPVLDSRWKKSTKQLATLGPASNTFESIEKLFLAGADIFRLNFSHGEHSEKAALVDIIRAIEEKYNHPICILGDLQGPKLRVGKKIWMQIRK